MHNMLAFFPPQKLSSTECDNVWLLPRRFCSALCAADGCGMQALYNNRLPGDSAKSRGGKA